MKYTIQESNRKQGLWFWPFGSLECAQPSAFPVGGIMHERIPTGWQRGWCEPRHNTFACGDAAMPDHNVALRLDGRACTSNFVQNFASNIAHSTF